MSSLNTGRVWRSYPGSGNELLLALALANCASIENDVMVISDRESVMRRCRFTPEQFAALFDHMLSSGVLAVVDEAENLFEFRFPDIP